MATTAGIAAQPRHEGEDFPIPMQLDPARGAPVYGTAEPSRGLPLVMRTVAYGYPAHDARRWLTLLMADQVAQGGAIVQEVLTPGQQGMVLRHFRRQAVAHPAGFTLTLGMVALALGRYLWTRSRQHPG